MYGQTGLLATYNCNEIRFAAIYHQGHAELGNQDLSYIL